MFTFPLGDMIVPANIAVLNRCTRKILYFKFYVTVIANHIKMGLQILLFVYRNNYLLISVSLPLSLEGHLD